MSPAELISVMAKVVLLPAAGAFVGALVKGRLEDGRLFRLRGTRNVSGRWTGHLHVPNESREKLTFDFQGRSYLNFRFWFNPRLVLAKVTVGDEIIECRGGFCHEEYLIMDYRSAQKHRNQFGSMLLRLDASGTILAGTVIGYYDTTFTGNIKITKSTP